MRSKALAALLCACSLALLLALPQGARALPTAAVGDPLPRVQCPPGYTARIYAQGLRSPDGLAISPAGILHVVQEIAGPAGSDSHVEADYIAVYRGQYLPLVLRPMEVSR